MARKFKTMDGNNAAAYVSYAKTVDDVITNDVQAHPTGQVASPASNERHRMAMGDPQDATTRTKGAAGPRAKGPGRPAGKLQVLPRRSDSCVRRIRREDGVSS